MLPCCDELRLNSQVGQRKCGKHTQVSSRRRRDIVARPWEQICLRWLRSLLTVKSLTLTLTRCKTGTSYFVPNDHLNLATSAISPSQPAPSLTYGTGDGVRGVDGGAASTRRGVDVDINGAQGKTLADDGAASQANEARRRWCEDSGRTCVRVARRPRGVARMACTVC